MDGGVRSRSRGGATSVGVASMNGGVLLYGWIMMCVVEIRVMRVSVVVFVAVVVVGVLILLRVVTNRRTVRAKL